VHTPTPAADLVHSSSVRPDMGRRPSPAGSPRLEGGRLVIRSPSRLNPRQVRRAARPPAGGSSTGRAGTLAGRVPCAGRASPGWCASVVAAGFPVHGPSSSTRQSAVRPRWGSPSRCLLPFSSPRSIARSSSRSARARTLLALRGLGVEEVQVPRRLLRLWSEHGLPWSCDLPHAARLILNTIISFRT